MKQQTIGMHSAFTSLVGAIIVVGLLAGCASEPQASLGAAKPQIEFVDLEGFDRQLSHSLSTKLPTVEVQVVNTTTATAIPSRLKAWLEAVESGGGTVKVSPPKSSVTSKSPMLILSLVSGIWNATRASKAVAAYELHKPARAYDAEIVLKIDDKGERLIDKIVLTERKAKS